MTGARRVSVTLLAVALALATMVVWVPPPAAAGDPACPSDANQDAIQGRTVVLLVHGFHSGPDAWESPTSSMAEALKGLPHTFVAQPFDYHKNRDNWVTPDPLIGKALARQIRCYADASADKGPAKIVLVAHSMGGLAIRCALDKDCGVPGNADRVGMVITLGTPNTGSQIQPPGSGGAQTVLGGALFDACQALNTATIHLTVDLADQCDWLQAAAFSSAGKAFRPGSAELAALPPWPPAAAPVQGPPVHALAGQAQTGLGWFFGPALSQPAGDLIVGTDSATAGTVDNPPVLIDCGTWAVGPVPDVNPLNPTGQTIGVTQRGSCWHGSETGDPRFIAAVTSLVAGYVGPAAPSTSSSPPPTPVPAPAPPAPASSAPSSSAPSPSGPPLSGPPPSAPSPPSKPPVDWQNNAYQVTCDGLVSAGFAAGMRGGTATVSGSAIASSGYDSITVTYQEDITGDLTGDGKPETVVLLTCTPQPSNLSVYEAQVFGPADELLTELPSTSSLQQQGQVLPPEYDVQQSMTIRGGDLRTPMLFYAPEDTHASGPSVSRTARWHWNGDQFQLAGLD